MGSRHDLEKMSIAACSLFFIFLALFGLVSYVQGQGWTAQTSVSNNGSLEGEWEFYWNVLLSPDEIDDLEMRPQQIPVPSSWHEYQLDGARLPKYGFATYRKQVDLTQEEVGVPMSLALHYVGSAYAVWIDGQPMKGMGKVGRSADSEAPQLGHNLIEFVLKREVVEIVLQVSNFSFREGGIIGDVYVTDAGAAHVRYVKDLFLKVFLIGGFIVIGFYLLIIYGTRTMDRAILFIGLGSLLGAVRILLVNEYLTYTMVPAARWTWMTKTEYVVEIAMVFFLSCAMKAMYPDEVRLLMFRIAFWSALLLSLYTLLSPTRIFTSTLVVHAAVLSGIILYYVFYVGILAAIRRREGARIYLIALFIMVASIMNDTLNYMGVWHTFMMVEFSIMLFALLQAVIVACRYALLKSNLEYKVRERTHELHLKNVELAHMQQTRTKMLSYIAHDLNSPLVGIQMYLQLMKDGMLPVKDQEALTVMQSKSDDMKKLVDNLFELSKLESGEMQLQTEPVIVKEFIDDLYRKHREGVRARSFNLRIGRLETELRGRQAIVRIDRFQLMRVIQNYIDNAVKFSNPQNNCIFLNSYIQDNNIRMEVVDQGVGISQEELPWVFQRFYKRKEGNPGGSGLGLAISQEIAEQHGGKVGVNSKPGKGSTFYVTMPIAGYKFTEA